MFIISMKSNFLIFQIDRQTYRITTIMNRYPAFLRPHHAKSTNSINCSSSSNNENDENSSIKHLIFRHISKAQQVSSSNNTKATMRGVLGEVGNMTLLDKPTISKPKVVQREQFTATIDGTTSIINGSPPAAPLSSSCISIVPMVVHQRENDTFTDNEDSDECIGRYSTTKFITVASEFDCDNGDSYNITAVSEYVVNVCRYWRELEQYTPIRQNFLLNRSEGKQSKYMKLVKL